jgi:hypothetical protein
MKMIAEKYLFYLSFENAVCDDYVTEKLFKVFDFNLIPIVMGGADYKTFAPKKSYIDIRNQFVPGRLTVTSRVTRLGEFSPHGSMFTLGTYFKITEASHIFGILYSMDTQKNKV